MIGVEEAELNKRTNPTAKPHLSMRKRASGPRSLDMDPYSKEIKETSKERPMQMSMYLQ